MNYIVISTVVFLVFMGLVIFKLFPKQNVVQVPFLFAWGFVLAAFFRFTLAFSTTGFEVDLALFQAWGELTHKVGFSGVYTQSSVYIDYPPGYLYVLNFMESIRRVLGLEFSTLSYYGILKMPAMLADLACGYIIYRFANKKFDKTLSSVISFTYLFSPFTIINSAIWGQIDSVATIILLASLIFLRKNKFVVAGAIFGLGVITKPQLIIFSPVFLFYTLFNKKFKGFFAGITSALAVIILVALPFSGNGNPLWLIDLYTGTFDYYNYYTINAYNFWGMIGFNWKSLPTDTILASVLDILPSLIATILCGVYLFFNKHKKEAIFNAAALTLGTVFMFATKMHERYLYSALIMLIFSFIYTKDRRYMLSFGGLTTLSFINTAYVLYLNNSYVEPTAPQIVIVSALNLVFFAFFVLTIFKPNLFSKNWIIAEPVTNKKGKKASNKAQNVSNKKSLLPVVDFEIDNTKRKMNRKDCVIALAITAFYSIFAFTNLGATTTANTTWLPFEGDSAVFEVDGDFSAIMMLSGIAVSNESYYRVGNDFDISVSDDNVNYTSVGSLKDAYVYDWKEVFLSDTAKYVKITANNHTSVLNEVAFRNTDSTGFVSFKLISDTGAELIDEQDSVPLFSGYMNSTYFDEIYHARTAYEHVLGLEPYEYTHPPLGKYIIAASISIFGMNPFGWRFAGALFGVLMLPIFYHLVKKLFSNTLIASCATFLFAFDFMHFAQTRIATVDTYAVFFTLLMIDFMVSFMQLDLKTAKFKDICTPLFFSGLFMGIGASAKWTCAYIGLGLAVLFAYKLITEHINATRKFKDYLFALYLRLSAYCAAFFIAIPALTYFVAYLPVMTLPQYSSDIIGNFFTYQTNMFNYHSQLVAEHGFASPWYEWPFNIRNMFMFVNRNYENTGLVSSISSFGNPILWWSSFVALIYVVYAYIKTRKQELFIIIAGFSAAYLPWVLVPRLTFIYHYFIATPFIFMALMYVFVTIDKSPKLGGIMVTKVKLSTILPIAFCVINFIMFMAFYPAISGIPASSEYLQGLSWLPYWYLA